MMLSLSRLSGLFNGLPHLPPAASPRDESPGFLHAGFASFEPDLTQEIRQGLGESAARDAGGDE
jgi:hypothetical protein